MDEYTLGEKVPDAASILKTHWDTWATLADFQKIADHGFNTVRIPIGCRYILYGLGTILADNGLQIGLSRNSTTLTCKAPHLISIKLSRGQGKPD